MFARDAFIDGLVAKTNLTKEVVCELLDKGWRYVEETGEISRWEHPMWQLDTKIVNEAYDPMIREVTSIATND